MGSNVEVKARARALGRQVRIAAALSGKAPEIVCQEDTFFKVPRGRLKLRVLSPDCGELIYYERDDSAGPKSSWYAIYRTADPGVLRAAMSAALGVRGVVRKVRRSYRVGRTRVHIDEVEGLGTFIELEVVLEDGQQAEEGSRIARELMRQLLIEESDLVSGAYIDLLEKAGAGC